MSLESAVRDALAVLDAAPVDRAASDLALTYAAAVDGGGDLARLGPALLSALEALGMTPRARAAATKGAKDDGHQSPLDELRARRVARQRAAEDLDTAPA